MQRFRNTQTGVLVWAAAVPTWGGTWEPFGAPVPPPLAAEPPTSEPAPVADPAPEIVTGPVSLPPVSATVKTWVEFMSEQGIEHPEGATKAEMRALAEEHFKEV